MKIIISLNGLEESSISTQIKILNKINPNLIDIIGKIDNISPFNKCSSNLDLCLLKNEKEEFINNIYKSINKRNEQIKSSNKPIIIIDKGIIDYDAIILSYLMSKTLNEKESLEFLKNKKNEFNLENLEDFQIIFINPSHNEAFICENNSEECQKFFKYNREQLEKLSMNEDYKAIRINSGEAVDEISKNINNVIYSLLSTKLSIPNNKLIFSINGINDSSKTDITNYLTNEYNTLNLKLDYFIYIICNKYNIKKENLNLNQSKYLSLLEAEEISNFLKYHNSQKFIILDSENSSCNIFDFKNIFNDIFKIIFIEAKEGNDSQEILKIKSASNYIIKDDKIRFKLMNQIDHIISQINIQKEVPIKEIDKINIPLKYKQLLENLYKEILNKLDVRLFVLHGSCSTGTVIENYSDIDLILVIEPNDATTRKVIADIISKCNNGIKVGTTIYTKKEIESLQVDFKTQYCLYLINKKENLPLFISDINIPIVNKYSIIQMNKDMIYGKIHELRRLLYNENIKEFDSLFKKLAHLMKDFLFVEEIEPKGYFHVYKTFSKLYKFDEFDVNKYFEDDNYKKEIVKYCGYILDKINICVESINKKRKAVRGIILKDDNIILMHRIKDNKEYYVYPGGGLENGETNEQCVAREIKQEIGINVKILKYLYRLEEEKDIEYYYLCEYLSGEVGTGTGPEYTDEIYINNGKYIPEIHKLNEISKLDLKKIISDTFLKDIQRYKFMKNIPFRNINNI